MITLNGLKPLYESMRQQGIDRYRFEYRRGPAAFDVFFFTDGTPFVLLFGAKGTQLAFEFQVGPGFRVENHSLEQAKYYELCRVLQLQKDPDNPFSPHGFLKDFNNGIPDRADANGRARPEDVASWRRDVEEANKIYFCGWLDDSKRGNRVTESNLAKTRKLLGEAAFLRSRAKNFSSRWTDDRTKAIAMTLP